MIYQIAFSKAKESIVQRTNLEIELEKIKRNLAFAIIDHYKEEL